MQGHNSDAVGYRKPPIEKRFAKGQSGNPRGRPKQKSDFFADAVEILGGNVKGRSRDKTITLPMVQAMFRSMCREALKGDNGALRRIIELQLVLVPKSDEKAAEAEKQSRRSRAIWAKLFDLKPDELEWNSSPKPKRKLTPEEKAERREIDRKVAQRRKELERKMRR